MLKPLLASPALLMLFAAPATAVQPPETDWARVEAMMQHFVVHVPRMTITRTTIIARSRPVAPPPPVAMVERKAKDCLEMRRIIGFGITQPDSVDLVLNDGSRMRARLGNNCRSLGFYQGFYVKPNPDGKMCAGRDPIRTRSGGECSIQVFKALVPAH
ncbi:MAG: hypothetical protein V4574_08660 [Pseudomonadota bacterium]